MLTYILLLLCKGKKLSPFTGRFGKYLGTYEYTPTTDKQKETTYKYFRKGIFEK